MPKGLKLGGRVKGTPNKATAAARDRFKTLIDNYSVKEMQADLEALSPKDRLSFISDIAEFVIPKLSRTEVQSENKHVVNWIIEKTYEVKPETNEGLRLPL